MTAALGATSSRFRLESHDHDGKFVCSLPYRNLQSESLLNDKGGELRCTVPFRNYKMVTPTNLTPGKHELWLFDNLYSDTIPVFSGPLWDATASSDAGVLNCTAQDPLSYLAKRQLKVNKIYVAQQPADMILDLIAYTNGVLALPVGLVASKLVSNASTITATYQKSEGHFILDLIKDISSLADGTDYYVRSNGNNYVLLLTGGKLKPSSLTLGLEYGGNVDNYSVQYTAQPIANEFNVYGTNGLVGSASDAAAQTAYDALYQDALTGAAAGTTAALNTAATAGLKGRTLVKRVPSLVTKKFTPIKDFDFGSQFNVTINDEYVQYTGLVRVIGWQITIGQGDKITTVIYSNDTAEVT